MASWKGPVGPVTVISDCGISRAFVPQEAGSGPNMMVDDHLSVSNASAKRADGSVLGDSCPSWVCLVDFRLVSLYSDR